MNPGLVYLLRRMPGAWLRRAKRRVAGTKGLLRVLGILLVLVLLVGPQFAAASRQTAAITAEAAAALRRWAPLGLTVMALFSVSWGVGVYFRKCEIDFLFPAPVGRRELLLYHLASRLLVVALSALWMAIFVLRWAGTWYGGLIGTFFSLAFLHLLAQAASLLLAAFSTRVGTRIRRLVLFGGVGLAAVGLLATWQLAPGATATEIIGAFTASRTVAVVTAPASVFVELFASETAAGVAGWSAASVAILAALFAAITMLDVAYTDAAVYASGKVQERLRRMRSGGGAIAAHGPSRLRLSIPAPPFLGGAGPIAWRQAIEAVRSLRGIVVTALLTVGIPVAMVSFMGEGHRETAALTIVVLSTVFLNQNLALDFRRDLDRMAYLKSLPLPPTRVGFGQILPGIVVFTGLQAVTIAALTAAFGMVLPWPWPLLLLLLPFNWLSMALDNWLFLLFPYRLAPNETGQVQFMGRIMMVMFARMLLLLLATGSAALLAWLLATATGSITVAGAGAGAVLVGCALLATRLLGRAFDRFDVTSDTPASA